MGKVKPRNVRNETRSNVPVTGTGLGGMFPSSPFAQLANKNANGKKDRATQLPDKIVTRKILAAKWWSL
ncbi:hypothetical protein LBMAG49_25760 [Planctomycetota bacterium]|nr:hypothetical protein LBMAG49_25760 [Planctomycetota bacterium]